MTGPGRPGTGTEPDTAGEGGDGDDRRADGDELRDDPTTGSTREDPSVDDVGLPPAGKDPMTGEAPSS